MVNQFIYQILAKIKKLGGQTLIGDDFDWSLYNLHYKGELEDISKVHTLILSQGEYLLRNNNLEKIKNIKPLHPNHRLLYETIIQLKPRSVIEFGCGGGDHLKNLGTLNPNIELNGCDISDKQLDLLHIRHPKLKANVFQQNITKPMSKLYNCFEIAYSQAVIMHIQEKNHHLIAIENMFNVASNQVVFQENWTRHSFMSDIIHLHEHGRIKWENIFFYYRVAPEYNKAHQMVVSASPLDFYNKLDDYNILER